MERAKERDPTEESCWSNPAKFFCLMWILLTLIWSEYNMLAQCLKFFTGENVFLKIFFGWPGQKLSLHAESFIYSSLLPSFLSVYLSILSRGISAWSHLSRKEELRYQDAGERRDNNSPWYSECLRHARLLWQIRYLGAIESIVFGWNIFPFRPGDESKLSLKQIPGKIRMKICMLDCIYLEGAHCAPQTLEHGDSIQNATELPYISRSN